MVNCIRHAAHRRFPSCACLRRLRQPLSRRARRYIGDRSKGW